jgi:hypothetical protein
MHICTRKKNEAQELRPRSAIRPRSAQPGAGGRARLRRPAGARSAISAGDPGSASVMPRTAAKPTISVLGPPPALARWRYAQAAARPRSRALHELLPPAVIPRPARAPSRRRRSRALHERGRSRALHKLLPAAGDPAPCTSSCSPADPASASPSPSLFGRRL